MEMPFSQEGPASLPASLWAATTAPGPDCPILQGNHTVDVAIVGAGFTGLAAALELKRAGASVAVLEAATVGWGASGRNNGLLAAGLKRDPDDVRRILGEETAGRLLDLSDKAPAIVEQLVREHGIDCDLKRRGWIQAAHSRRAIPLIERRVRQWQALGADVEMLDPAVVADRLGTDYYAGAWFDGRGGSLNPLAYACGLATAAVGAGAQLFERSPVVGTGRSNGRWIVAAPGGTVNSAQLLLCVNAYNAGLASVQATVIPVRTAQIASAPLPRSLRRKILPGGESCSDTQRLLTSFRLTADNRLIMGGGAATAGDESERLFRRLRRAAQERFPQLGQVPWEFGWSGYLALTSDHLPSIFEVGSGAWSGVGCNGRGIAMATATGQALAAICMGKATADCAIPMSVSRSNWKYRYRRVGVMASDRIGRILDIAEHRLAGG